MEEQHRKRPIVVAKGIPATDSVEEKSLLKYLESDISEATYLETLWQLVWFYNSIRRNDLAVDLIERIMASAGDTEQQARGYLALGEIAEQKQRYEAALDYYSKGITLKPKEKGVAYFLHNNAGYCLNILGKHEEAERYCRLAIQLDSERANAFKNLGISLEGLEDLVGAAWAYVEATKADARDSRAFRLLEKLIADHPELPSQFPGILKELDNCRKAVEIAAAQSAAQPARMITDTYEICQLKYVPGKGFGELKEGVEREISKEEVHRLYSEEALVMLGRYPSTWCLILAPGAAATTEEDQRKYLLDLLERVLKEGPRFLKQLRPSLLISPPDLDSKRQRGT